MEDGQRAVKIELLKKTQYELGHLGRGEFLRLIADRFGEDWAGVVARLSIEENARRLMNDQIEAQLRELGE